ncbi:MAG: hypothetical protein BGO55_24155 [Sphingobacteriales bacterium 50-39]|nr:hypothetical protein [Sphingobacteriales bacterium]OJW58392.1 MAG: hypothetical protein BGO55_24155 [Sphingobacteriales bacterium 50-39]
MNTFNNQWTRRKLQSRLKKFLKIHKEYFKTHTFTYHVFRVHNEPELWEAIKALGGTKAVRKELGLELPCHHEKWTKEQLMDELWRIHNEGHPITKLSLINMGRSELLSVIRHLGTLSSIKREMGFKAVEKQDTTADEVLETYRKLYISLGVAPTCVYLEENGYSALPSRIRTHFGSITALKRKLKIPLAKKPNHHWSLRNTLKSLRLFYKTYADEIHRTSMHRVLTDKKELGLIHAIGIHGGLSFLNKKYKLGLYIVGKKWNKEKVISRLKILHSEGHDLSKRNLRKIGHADLAGNIHRYGWLSKIREEIGAPGRKYKHWNDDTIVVGLEPIVKQFDCIPSQTVLRSIKRQDLIAAMRKHGGVRRFSELMNVPIRTLHKADDGHYLQSSYECIFDNILNKHHIPHQTHVLITPDLRYKCDFLIQKTYIEIAGYYRKGDDTYERNMQKKERIYKRLNKDVIIIPARVFKQRPELIEMEVLSILKKIKGLKRKIKNTGSGHGIMPRIFWSNAENIKVILQPHIEKYGRMPQGSELKREGLGALVSAVTKYHNSLFDLAEKWGLETKGVRKGHYTAARIRQEYVEICLEQGRTMSVSELRSLGKINLANAIDRTRCIKSLRSFLERKHGDRIGGRPDPYTIRRAVCEYKDLCEKEQKFLTLKEAKEKGFGQLLNFMKRKKIGIHRLRKMTRLDYLPKVLPVGYYTEAYAVAAYTKICHEKGYFLTGREARQCMPIKLAVYIDGVVGLSRIRKLSGLKLVVKQNRPQISREEAVDKYRKICIREKYHVTMNRLVQLGEGKLARFILKEFKYPVIKKMINLDLPYRSPAHISKYRLIYEKRREKKKRMTIKAYEKICLKQKRHLSNSELKDLEMGWIANAIRAFGGITGFRNHCKKTAHLHAAKIGRRKSHKYV